MGSRENFHARRPCNPFFDCPKKPPEKYAHNKLFFSFFMWQRESSARVICQTGHCCNAHTLNDHKLRNHNKAQTTTIELPDGENQKLSTESRIWPATTHINPAQRKNKGAIVEKRAIVSFLLSPPFPFRENQL